MKTKNELAIYQTESGGLELSIDNKKDTIWANLNQISKLFDKDKSVISRHIKNVFESKELKEREVVAFFATTASDGKTYNVQYYNLDLILSVGYRVNSKQATKFRQWATKILKSYMMDGYAINNNRIKKNYDNFLKAIEDIKLLVADNSSLKNDDIIELIKTFANTWLSLDKYDKDVLPTTGNIEKDTKITAKNFEKDLEIFKNELIKKNEATEFFATERINGNLENIFCNVFQSFDGIDVYKTLEEKASNLLYFMIKNHPFIDGNKRSGAYSFIWFLRKNNILNINKINPQTLTILTILIAESNPKDKEKMIGLILQILE